MKKYVIAYTVYADSESEAWDRINELVIEAITCESTLSNTFGITEEVDDDGEFLGEDDGWFD